MTAKKNYQQFEGNQYSKKLLILFILVSFVTTAQPQLKPFYSSENDKYGYVDEKGNVIVSPRYDLAWNFAGGMSMVKGNGKYGYIDETGTEAISPRFERALPFSDGLAVVKINGKYGYIDKTGKLVVPAIYDRCNNFHGDRANVLLNGEWEIMIYHFEN